MMRIAYTAATACLLMFGLPFAQGEAPRDETRIALREEFLRLINRDRSAAGLLPVRLDPHASAIADSYCEQQIRNGTTGHFTTDGLAPYMRYSLAGGNDSISENAAAWSASYRFTDRALLDMVHRSEKAMMTEVPPNDGHRKAILDPFATHVGIGLAWKDGEFRITQEFVRRYIEWHSMPRSAAPGDHIIATGRPFDGYRAEAISVHREPLPRALTADEASLINSYKLPEERRDYLPRLRSYTERRKDGTLYAIREQYADGRRGDFTIAKDGTFSFAVPLNDGPGIYTVVVWLRHAGVAEPIPASNVSIRVDGRAVRRVDQTRGSEP